jgi:hypothetical protein
MLSIGVYRTRLYSATDDRCDADHDPGYLGLLPPAKTDANNSGYSTHGKLHGRTAGDPVHGSGPTLALYIFHRVRGALYVAQDVRSESVLAEYVQNLQQLLTVEGLPGATFVDPSRVKVRVLFSAGTAGVHLSLR